MKVYDLTYEKKGAVYTVHPETDSCYILNHTVRSQWVKNGWLSIGGLVTPSFGYDIEKLYQSRLVYDSGSSHS